MSNLPYYLESIRAGLRRGVTVPVRNEAIRCVRELENYLCRETDEAPDDETDPVNGQLVSARVSPVAPAVEGEPNHPDVGDGGVPDIDAEMLINGKRREFVDRVQFYLNELLEDDAPLHIIGHIESECTDYEKLIRDAVRVYGNGTPEPPPASPPASDAGGEKPAACPTCHTDRQVPPCWCFDEWHPQNKPQPPPSGQGPTEALTKGELARILGELVNQGGIILPDSPGSWFGKLADELAKGGGK